MSRIMTAFYVVFFTGLAATSVIAKAQELQTPVTQIEQGSIHENICHLNVYRSGQARPNQSSAVLYNKRYLITAAHNVLQARRNITKIEVRCGVIDAETTPVQQTLEGWRSQRAKRFTFWRGFPSKRDFGVILLKEPIETATPVSLSSSAPRFPDEINQIPGEKVCLYGYPGDDFSNAYTLYEKCQPITGPSFFGRSIRYNILTYTGNSGGPVIRHTPNGPELVAVHVQPSSGRLADDLFQRDVAKLIEKLEDREAQQDD